MPGKPTDWGDRDHRKNLIDSRRHLWRDDTVAMHARWLGLRNGMAMLDVGCGRGYLGQVWWRFCGPSGTYTGVDVSRKLIGDARISWTGWAPGRRARFVRADAGSLPFPDDSFDWTVCQTLLMHMERPGDVLAEMVRVTKPGCVISCNEPDNYPPMVIRGVDSLPAGTEEEEILRLRVTRHWIEGRRKLGKGDWRIGPKIPGMMRRLGLEDIDIRVNDMVVLIQPPYDAPMMKSALRQIRDGIGNAKRQGDDWKRDPSMKEFRDCFFAGGGTRYLWRKHLEQVEKDIELRTHALDGQLRARRFSSCPSGCFFFSVRGRKPVRRKPLSGA